LAVNRGRCTCTNAFLAVDFRSDLFGNGGFSESGFSAAWGSPAGRLSCELEGHPLGGGMLKIEPGDVREPVLEELPVLGSGFRMLCAHVVEDG